MGTVNLNPYLFFKGNCREAMEFYKTVFGGDLTLQTYAEGPGTDDESKKDWIIHAALTGGDAELYGADGENASPAAKKIALTLTGPDEARLRKIFEGLADGGKTAMPLQKQFWGDVFGQLTDKYGIDWQINILAKK